MAEAGLPARAAARLATQDGAGTAARACAAIEALAETRLDAGLLARLGPAAVRGRPLAAATPSFRSYQGSALQGCAGRSYPAFSITGAACALMCRHCRAEVLKPMIPATSPDALEAEVRRRIAHAGLRGFLLSGGSSRRNEVPYARFLPVLARLTGEFPFLRIAVHAALMDRATARALAEAGVDTAMMDVIGAAETVAEIYRLDRPLSDYEATLAALCESGMRVVPHIVLGLHYGELRGEWAALEMIARHPVDGLVLVALMAHHGEAGRFAVPDPAALGAFFLDARRRLPALDIELGCARPHGFARRAIDAYAVLAGLDGIAFPAEGAVELAQAIGRPVRQQHGCCALREAGNPVPGGCG